MNFKKYVRGSDIGYIMETGNMFGADSSFRAQG